MKKYYIVSCILFILTVLILFPGLLPSRTFFARDLTYVFQPWRVYAQQEIQTGRVPLWNPYTFCGMPFLANLQSAIFYPFSVLFYLFSFPVALKMFYIINFFLAGLFFYLFVQKKCTLSPLPSLIGSLIWCFNGYFISKLEFLSLLSCAIWLPAILLIIDNPVLFSLVLSLSFLSGYPDLFVFQLVIVFLYHFFSFYINLFTPRQKNGFVYRNLNNVGVQFIEPDKMGLTQSTFSQAVERVGFSRPFRFVFDTCRIASFPPIRYLFKFICVPFILLMGFVAVQLIPTIELFLNSYRFKEGISYPIGSLYSATIRSLAGLALPLPHLFRTADSLPFTGEKYFWATTAYFGITATIFIFLAILKIRLRNKLLYLLIFFTGLLLSLGKNLPGFEFLYNNLYIGKIVRYPGKILYLSVFTGSILTTLGLKYFSASKFISGQNQWLYKFGIFLLVILEFVVYAHNFHPTINQQYFYTNHTARSLQKRVGQKYRFFPTPKTAHRQTFYAGNIYYSWLLVKEFLPNSVCLPYRLYRLDGYDEPLTIYRYEKFITKILTKPDFTSAVPLLTQYNVGVVLSLDELSYPGLDKINEQPINIYTLPFPNTRVTWYQITEPTPYLSSNNLEREGVGSDLTQKSLSSYKFEPVNIIFDLPEKLSVNLPTNKPGLLVLTDTYFPGWQAYVNGNKTKIYPFAETFRSLIITESGMNKINLIYRPLSYILGVWITVITLMALIIYTGIKLFHTEYIKHRNSNNVGA